LTVSNDEPITSVISLTFNIEKTVNEGEDAPPVLIHSSNCFFLSVCDGMGGAGSTSYSINGIQTSGAYISSRLVNKQAEIIFSEIVHKTCDLKDNILVELKSAFCSNLQAELIKIKGEGDSKLKSKLLKDLPTTFSGLFIKLSDNRLIVDSIWAGDSRNYLLTEQDGLQQLSSDDLKQKFDPFENLTKDSPLDNIVSAEGDFNLHQMNLAVPSPCILFSVTDGCYGYYHTPMQFEYAVLDSMLNSNNEIEWEKSLIEAIGLVAGDDYSIALVAIGYNSFETLKTSFQSRREILYGYYVNDLIKNDKLLNNHIEEKKIIENDIKKIDSERLELQKKIWEEYKITYLKHIPTSV